MKRSWYLTKPSWNVRRSPFLIPSTNGLNSSSPYFSRTVVKRKKLFTTKSARHSQEVCLGNQKLTVHSWQSSPIELDRNQISQDTFFVLNRVSMTMIKRKIQVLFCQLMLIFKHIQPSNIIPICHHLSHGSTFIQFSGFHRLYQVLAESKNVETKVHSKELIHNGENTCFLGPQSIKWRCGLWRY
jgi:hypothetical protein